MKFSHTLILTVMACTLAAPAYAGSFSFNKASAEKMVAACKEEGIELTMDQANAIVAARKDKRFTTVDDLTDILPGRKISELDPIEEDDDLIFNPNAMPGMKAY
ncbi:type II secretion system protein GspK [uncultured Mailhella sp.]|uniref:type II secretion system protein GspK n=1 Tax=uncultured Mailhella sp. TaxID=1981031 RepID=UPI0025F1A6A8|nr:type II secretion system protein GspK [uncultured Mailhella sp.]